MSKKNDRGTTEIPERETSTCPYCKEPVTWLWCRGFVVEPTTVLVADAVFHAACWDRLIEEHPP